MPGWAACKGLPLGHTATGYGHGMTEPEKQNLTSPKGDATMPEETDDTTTASSHNKDGVSTVPKDPAEAEAARTGEKSDATPTSAPTYAEEGDDALGGTPPGSDE